MKFLRNNKYIKYVWDRGNETLANHLIYMIEKGLIDDLQLYLNNKYGTKLIVDGIFGMNTLVAIDTAMRKDHGVIDNFITLNTPKKPTIKKMVLTFLADAEGTIVHFNKKTETSYTAPYGIYRKVFPNATVIKYIDSLYRKYNLNIESPKDARRINYLMTNDEKELARELAWEFYKKYFIAKPLLDILDTSSFLTYFSISVNGGKKRGGKAIQHTIHAKADGAIGPSTIKHIKDFLLQKDFTRLNFGMLEYMYNFYRRLISMHSEYSIYKNGWYNRLLKTSCGLFQRKYRSL